MDLIEELISRTDLRWLDDAACAELDEKAEAAGEKAIDLFFVEAGHVIDEHTLNVCRGCPVRVPCIERVYAANIKGGYFGGLSPGQRSDMSIEAALEFARKDPPIIRR